MRPSLLRSSIPLVVLGLLTAGSAFPQAALTVPPGGDNQRSVVTQYMGFVAVTVDYNSPDVTAPNGEDRTGKIWGQLVPYGLTNAGFGNGNPSPWRAGANENTTITLSHDVEVEGKALAAGTYGLHFIPGEDDWTVIFSNNSTSWGSFFYDESEDALRVTVKAEKEVPFREWLTYDFLDRQLDSTVVAMHWEHLRVPFRVSVPDLVDRYVERMGDELRGSAGFLWQNWNAAAQMILARDPQGRHLDQALQWADAALAAPFVGQENFQTLVTKAQVLQRLERGAEALAIVDRAVEHPTANANQIHGLGRQLIGQGEGDRALAVFKKSYERFDGAWPTHVGMARGYSAVGEYAKAIEHAKKALAQAPNDLNRTSLQGMIETLEGGEDVNG
ncbi:MAG: DUF2911 domain-containing protein [Acidobacteriota bacterium]